MKADDLPHAYELNQELLQAQKAIAHLEAMNDADTVSLTITGTPPSNVTIGSAAITVGPLLRCFKHYAEDLRTTLINYGVEL